MTMRTSMFLLVSGLALVTPGAAIAQAGRTPDVTPFLMANQAEEIRLARSAAPAFISDSATVLVLGRDGFVEAAHGKNGFTCVVIRSLSGRLDDPELFNPRIRAPHCFNAPAVRTVLPTLLKQTEWVLSGARPSDIMTRIEHAYAAHTFPPPESGAMAYMLSPEQYLTDNGTHWLPHLMFFFDKSFPPAAWGAHDGGASPIVDGSAGDPHAPYLTFIIPVRKWASGAPASM